MDARCSDICKAYILTYRTAQDLQVVLPALGIPSFLKLACDGFTPNTGDPLDVQMAVAATSQGAVDCILLDMAPVRRRPAETPTEQVTKSRMDTLKYKFGVGWKQLRWRFLGLVGDGLLAGPFSTNHGQCFAGKIHGASWSSVMPGNCWDSLDPLHASDSAGSHADWPEMSPGTGYIHKFHSTARALRVRFAYGKGQTIARSVAKRFGLEWHRPMAPHTESTRLIIYESRRIPPNYLANLRTCVGAIAFQIQDCIQSCRQQALKNRHTVTDRCGLYNSEVRRLRNLGRALLDPGCLVFTALRYDSRRTGLLRFAYAAQNRRLSGAARLGLCVETLRTLRAQLAALQGLTGVVGIWQRLAAFVDGSRIPRILQPARSTREAFVEVFAAETCRADFPTAVDLVLELLFKRTIHGCPVGFQTKESHPFCEPHDVLQRHNETTQGSRDRMVACLSNVFSRFRKWLRDEIHFFKCRVMCWSSNMPSNLLTAKGLTRDVFPAADNTDGLTSLIDMTDGEQISKEDCLQESAAQALQDVLEQMSGGGVSSASSSLPTVDVHAFAEADTDADSAAEEDSDADDDAGGVPAPVCRSWPPRPWTLQCVARDLKLQLQQDKQRTQGRFSVSSFRKAQKWQMLVSKRADGRLVIREEMFEQAQLWETLFSNKSCNTKGAEWRPGPAAQLLASAARLFEFSDLCSPASLFDPLEVNLKKASLRVLCDVFGRFCWGRQREFCPYKKPPDELFSNPSQADLWQQYIRLRQFAKALVNAKAPDMSKMFWGLQDAWLLQTFLQAKPAKIRQHSLWHILCLWHAVYMWSLSSSAACEGVGGVCRWLERKKVGGRAWSTGHLVRATLLRYNGVRGGMGDVGFAYSVLQYHRAVHPKMTFWISRRVQRKRESWLVSIVELCVLCCFRLVSVPFCWL